MNKKMNGILAAMVATATFATAMPAQAQSRWQDSDRDGRPDRAEWNRDRDRDGRPDQYDRRDGRGWRDSDRDGRPDRAEWNRDRDRDGRPDQWDRRDNRRDAWNYRNRDGSWRYYGGNYGYNGYRGQWRTGQRYPYYSNSRYYLSDYGYYGLPAPRRGYRYYRDNNGDIVMATIAGGIIGLIVGGALDNDRDGYRRRW